MANWGGAASGAASGAAAGSALGPWGSLAGGVIGGIGGLFGGGGGDDDEAKAAYQRALEEMSEIGVPREQAMRVIAAQQGGTQMRNIDASFQQAKMRALSNMQSVGEQGGLDLNSRAAMEEATQRANQNAQARSGEITNQMAARGQLNSGNALAMQLSNSGIAANAVHSAGNEAAVGARQRALQAMSGAGQMGGQLWGQGAQAANAQDMINRYNTESTNHAKYYNAQLPAQQFQMQMHRAQSMAAA